MATNHFNQLELARRWALSPRTLERWRWLRQGPAYLKIGNRIVYRLADIERHESEHLHDNQQSGSRRIPAAGPR